MTQKISIVILACVVVLVSAVLSGCGSSSPSNVTAKDFTNVLTTGNTAGTGGTTTYGTLTLSGSGIAITGTTYTAKALVVASSGPTGSVYSWMDNSTWSYPLTTITIVLDAAGNVTSVMAIQQISGIANSGTWAISQGQLVLFPTTISNSPTARTFTFNQLPLLGVFNTGTMTALTVNGTLKY